MRISVENRDLIANECHKLEDMNDALTRILKKEVLIGNQG